jgi:hypothetical protein
MGLAFYRWFLTMWLAAQAEVTWDFPPNAEDVVIREPGLPGLGWSWGEGEPVGLCAQTGSIYSDLKGRRGRVLWVCEEGSWIPK